MGGEEWRNGFHRFVEVGLTLDSTILLSAVAFGQEYKEKTGVSRQTLSNEMFSPFVPSYL